MIWLACICRLHYQVGFGHLELELESGVVDVDVERNMTPLALFSSGIHYQYYTLWAVTFSGHLRLIIKTSRGYSLVSFCTGVFLSTSHADHHSSDCKLMLTP
jgi:hypothetical protein